MVSGRAGRSSRLDERGAGELVDTDRPRFNEFIEVGRRMGVWSDVRFSALRGGTPLQEGATEFGILYFDGVAIGFLSDGTLRIAELLRYILSPVQRLLLIEEPETSLHPGLLDRLLAEFDAYVWQHQMIISTHSPQVVRNLAPPEIRLVSRRGRVTTVSPLNKRQIAGLSAYLGEQGHLGDYVFGGATDE